MDFQNVKELTITEGDVKTIHDSQNRLLWGAVGYNTTYRGDTTQPTYTGTNLWDVNNPYKDGYSIPANGVESENSSFAIYGNFESAANTSYTISAMGGTGVTTLRIHAYNLNGVWVEQIKSISMPASTEKSEQFTSPNYPCLIRISASKNLSQQQLVTSNPNPDYPQPINVVTGTQTITVTDGNANQTYTVNLGAIELCKIGTYQDYIYKNGDNWYVHKETGKINLNSLTWQTAGTLTADVYKMRADVPSGTYLPPSISSEPIIGLCTHYIAKTEAQLNNLVEGISGNTAGTRIFVYDPSYNTSSSANGFQTWVNTAKPIFYYILTTPTDTQITDNTLIGQLNAIHEWMTRYGYQSSVSGALPIIINQTALS